MRRALAIAAALALAACKVDVEGAHCDDPGSPSECPDGQACGNDKKCSTRAAACAAALCTPGVTPDECRSNAVETCTGTDPVCGTWSVAADCTKTSQVCEAAACVGKPCTAPGNVDVCPAGQTCGNDMRCSTAAAQCQADGVFCTPSVTPDRCQSNAVQTCTTANAVCGTWSVTVDCTTNSLVCDASAGAPACKCSAPGATIAADPAAPASSLIPTGAAQPPQCRFKTLGAALAAAVAGGGPAIVKAYGEIPVVFKGETFPLDVPAAVTISGADALALDTVIQGDAGTADTMVTLQGTLEHVHLQNVSMTGDAVDTACGTGTPTLRDVTVSSGTMKLAKGIAVSGTCGALLQGADVSGASGAALEVAASDAGAAITVQGSKFYGSKMGVQATGGTLRLEPDAASGAATEVTGNDTFGIELVGATPGATPTIDATLTGVIVAGNGGTGIYVKDVATASSLTMTSCNVHSNASASAVAYGLSGRVAGGILLSQLSLTGFQMQGNNVYANHGTLGADELVFESSSSWTIRGGTDCISPPSNAFGCLKNGSLAVSVWPGKVDAKRTIWPDIPPTFDISAGVDPGSSATNDGPCDTWSNKTGMTCP